MTRERLLLVVGVVLVLLGALFTLQGVGVLGGSPMTGSPTWATLGPVIAVVGVVLLVLRRSSRR